MKYFLPLHYDGGNRGCEAITKGTAVLLGQKPENIVAYCRDMDLDRKLGVDKYATLVPYERKSYLIDRILAALNKFFHTNTTLRWRLLYLFRSFMKQMSRDDIMLSTGGDMMCYGNNEIIYTNDHAHKKGIKTILWGCSMGPENLTPEKKKTLFNYSLIYARESLTSDFLKQLGLKNVCLCPDPAFVLEAEECQLPEVLARNETVGLNLSSFVMKGTSLDSDFGEEVVSLINHIMRETTMSILLIPHVTWTLGDENQDDRQIADIIYSKYKESGRVDVLDISGMNYCNIRYAISKCRLFIGARTHSVISAYSMCVPTIALGYSIKSKGIAKDLGLADLLVVESRQVTKGRLTESFRYLSRNEACIRSHLEKTIPAYIASSYNIRDHISRL
ncbi:MAG: polysaccharide pyruvyl transferase family protein [Bacteroidaceae bacterium]|nr:polysaccharide pyruvyl transferase family protein [Bacteroidaceae bacterium]